MVDKNILALVWTPVQSSSVGGAPAGRIRISSPTYSKILIILRMPISCTVPDSIWLIVARLISRSFAIFSCEIFRRLRSLRISSPISNNIIVLYIKHLGISTEICFVYETKTENSFLVFLFVIRKRFCRCGDNVRRSEKCCKGFAKPLFSGFESARRLQ